MNTGFLLGHYIQRSRAKVVRTMWGNRVGSDSQTQTHQQDERCQAMVENYCWQFHVVIWSTKSLLAIMKSTQSHKCAASFPSYHYSFHHIKSLKCPNQTKRGKSDQE